MKHRYPFTHEAWFWGIPCYFGDEDGDNNLVGRNLIYDGALVLALMAHASFSVVAEMINPNFESGFPICIGQELTEAHMRELQEYHEL